MAARQYVAAAAIGISVSMAASANNQRGKKA